MAPIVRTSCDIVVLNSVTKLMKNRLLIWPTSRGATHACCGASSAVQEYRGAPRAVCPLAPSAAQPIAAGLDAQSLARSGATCVRWFNAPNVWSISAFAIPIFA